MRILPEETGAVVIDMQEKLMMAMNETKACEEKAAMLLKGLQVLSIPTVIVQQYTKGLGMSVPEVWETHCRHFMKQQAQRNTVRRHLSAVAEIRRFLISLRVWGRRIFL